MATNTSDALAEANPPFVPELMEAMVAHLESLLEVAEAAGEALSFAVLVPRWAQLPFHRRLERSRYDVYVFVADIADNAGLQLSPELLPTARCQTGGAAGMAGAGVANSR